MIRYIMRLFSIAFTIGVVFAFFEDVKSDKLKEWGEVGKFVCAGVMLVCLLALPISLIASFIRGKI